MGTAKDVLAQYEKLDMVEKLRVLAELRADENDDWDNQIQADAESGKLDFLLDEALAAEKGNKLKDLCA